MKAHGTFIRHHLESRTGERRGRLERGHHALLAEKEIIRLAIQFGGQIRPKDVERHFEIDHKTTVLMLKKLCI